MILKRKENWGTLTYDTDKNRFQYVLNRTESIIPYSEGPVLLNVYLTMNCNLACMHCVTKDFKKPDDLIISKKLLKWINKSPFIVIVITGGEPFLPAYENDLKKLISRIKIKRKGIIIDTNGTNLISASLMRFIARKKILVRVSWDSTRPQDEIYFRHVRTNKPKNFDLDKECFLKKIKFLKLLQSNGIKVAVQSVINKKNLISIREMPSKLKQLSIRQWYIQRFILSNLACDRKKYEIKYAEYDNVVSSLVKKCEKEKIECIAKRDKRHNSVFILVGKGLLYTQGHMPKEKIFLGSINSKINFFDRVSIADHDERYYG